MKSSWVNRYCAGTPSEQEAIMAERRETATTILTLRALSRTCSRLRAFALPMLWAVIHLHSEEELRLLRDTFRAWPFIAQHVRSIIVWSAPPSMAGSITEVIAQLTSLQAFGWMTSMLAVPLEVCSALGRLTGLRRLHTGLFAATGKCNACECLAR